MKLSDIARNVAAIEAGAWIKDIPGMGDLEIKVRGKENADWRVLETALIAALPPAARVNGRIVPAEIDRITGQLLRDTALLDWKNLEDGPYTKDMANTLLTDPQYGAFRDAVLWAATVVAQGRAEAVEATIKN